jgi:hypothetical protein
VLVLYLTGVGVGIMVCAGIIVSARIDTCIIVCAGIILDRCRRGYKIPNIQRSLALFGGLFFLAYKPAIADLL